MAARRRRRLGTLVLALAVADVVVAMVVLKAELAPRKAIRTDLEGRSDVIVIPKATAPREAEVLEFVKQYAYHAFSRTPSTAESHHKYVELRSSRFLRARLSSLIPGYQLASYVTSQGSTPRVSMRIESLRVREGHRLRVDLLVAVKFWRTEGLPDDPGYVDPQDHEWHLYERSFDLEVTRRSEAIPEGLIVTGIGASQLQ